jgi:hypothetical protein
MGEILADFPRKRPKCQHVHRNIYEVPVSFGGWKSNYVRTVDKAEAEHNLDVTLP